MRFTSSNLNTDPVLPVLSSSHPLCYLSLPPHLLFLSSPLPSCLPRHTAGTVATVQQGKGHWRQHFRGQQGMQHTAAVRLCGTFHMVCEAKWWTTMSTSPVGERADWNGYQLEDSAQKGGGGNSPPQTWRKQTHLLQLQTGLMNPMTSQCRPINLTLSLSSTAVNLCEKTSFSILQVNNKMFSPGGLHHPARPDFPYFSPPINYIWRFLYVNLLLFIQKQKLFRRFRNLHSQIGSFTLPDGGKKRVKNEFQLSDVLRGKSARRKRFLGGNRGATLSRHIRPNTHVSGYK